MNLKSKKHEFTYNSHQGRANAAPNPPVWGGPSQNGGPTFYFTTITLKVGIVDQS